MNLIMVNERNMQLLHSGLSSLITDFEDFLKTIPVVQQKKQIPGGESFYDLSLSLANLKLAFNGVGKGDTSKLEAIIMPTRLAFVAFSEDLLGIERFITELDELKGILDRD